jgi:Fe-S-cluster containining protein
VTIPHPGPLAGDAQPVHGGRPNGGGCNGCIDCCHLPEISVTDEEATRLLATYRSFEQPLGELSFSQDPAHEGWQIMAGPCVFRRYDRPLARGGCRIYDDRPSGCAIFTCRLLLDLRRAAPLI